MRVVALLCLLALPAFGGIVGTTTDITILDVSGSFCPSSAFVDTSGNHFPDSSCTGYVPTGVTLTAYTGPSTITTNNTIIDSKDISTCLWIQAQNVTIKRSRVRVTNASCGPVLVFLSDEDAGFNNWALTIQDTEIDCGGDPPAGQDNSTGIGSAFITGVRLNIHGCENGGDINQNFDIQDSYIHDLRECGPAEGCAGDGSHTDAFQFTCCGHITPPGSGTVVPGTINVTLKRNTMFSMKAGSTTPDSNASHYTTSAIITNTMGQTTVNTLIDGNLLAGGQFTIYCQINSTGNNYRVTNNRFSTRYKSTYGWVSHSTDCADEAAKSGNVSYETGAAITLN